MTYDEEEPPSKKFRSEDDNYSLVGIELFYNKNCTGFDGIIKERWEDFIVNEVSLSKEVIKYTSNEIKPDIINSVDKLYENTVVEPLIFQKLTEASNSSENVEVEIEAPESKSKRTEIYEFVKNTFKNLYGNTTEKNNKKFIVFSNFQDERSKIAIRNAKNSGIKPYCQFVLHKKGIDTLNAIGIISKYLKSKPNYFTYAGTKDRRGITTQLVTVKGCAAERLQNLNKVLKNIYIGNFEYRDTPIMLGDLYGNRFNMVVRNVTESDDKINESISSFSNGFINYYGLQRFGCVETKTYELGKFAIACNWEAMVKAILEPSVQDLPFVRNLKEGLQKTNDYEEFVRNVSCGVEKTLVTGILKHGISLNAIEFLPRNLRQLYVHSYQSYIWNKLVSRRLSFEDRKVLPGDLVFVDSTNEKDVEYVKEDDVSKYSITDIVLPLPGYDVKLPNNIIKEWMLELLEKDGLTMEKLKHKVKDFSLPGAYRKMIVVPEEVSHQIYRYDDPTIPLLESDYEKVTGQFNMPPNEGNKKSVIVKFTLPKSSYATIAMREMMKSVTVMQ